MKVEYNPNVCISFGITMQRMSNVVVQGNYHWIGGSVRADKALAMASKFDQKWGLSQSKDQRYRRRKNGEATFRFFLYPQFEGGFLDWFLLRTDGTHPSMDSEQWRRVDDARSRIIWRGYELIQLPYTKAQRDAFKASGRQVGTKSWTWQMSAEYETYLRKRIRSAVGQEKASNGRNLQLFSQVLHALNRAPCHRGVRSQIYDLRKYVNQCRRRAGLASYDFGIPIPWMGGRKCREYPLSVLVFRVLNGEETWFPPATRGTARGVFARISGE